MTSIKYIIHWILSPNRALPYRVYLIGALGEGGEED